jgi:hypothetical protein
VTVSIAASSRARASPLADAKRTIAHAAGCNEFLPKLVLPEVLLAKVVAIRPELPFGVQLFLRMSPSPG